MSSNRPTPMDTGMPHSITFSGDKIPQSKLAFQISYEPPHEIMCLHGFGPGLTQKHLYSHRGRLEARNLGVRKYIYM